MTGPSGVRRRECRRERPSSFAKVALEPTWSSGERRAESGERRAESGERRAESGERRAESGERRAESGERRAESGERRAESGERRAESGERRAESGERRAESGERRADEGRLAQLVRASGLHPVGRGFESLTAHHRPWLAATRHDGRRYAGLSLRKRFGEMLRARRGGRWQETGLRDRTSPAATARCRHDVHRRAGDAIDDAKILGGSRISKKTNVGFAPLARHMA